MLWLNLFVEQREVILIYTNPTCHDTIIAKGVFTKIGVYPEVWKGGESGLFKSNLMIIPDYLLIREKERVVFDLNASHKTINEWPFCNESHHPGRS